ncbi:MAG: hypothetical protein AB7N24_19390 [Dehalococcoidia bacterium]
MVDMNAVMSYEPRWPGVKELNIEDQWRARWVDEQTLPAGAPVHFVYSLLVMGDKGYALRESGESVWGMLEGANGDVAPETFVKNAAKERAGATLAATELIGFYECKATRHNKDFEPGATTVRPFYVAVVKTISDVPPASGFERRRFPLNEYAVAMRAHYPELVDHLPAAFQWFAVHKAKS